MSETSPSEQNETEPSVNERYEARKQFSLATAGENVQIFMEWVEQQGLDWNNEQFISGAGRAFVEDLNELFGKEYGLSVSKEDLPGVAVYDKSYASYVPWYITKDSAEKKSLNIIFVGRINEILNGNTLGEELGHFYRCNLAPGSEEEAVTSEFFGFLGKRLWEKVSQKDLGLPLDLLKTEAEHVIEPKKQFIKSSKTIKRVNKEFLAGLKDFADQAPNEEVRQFWQETIDETEKNFIKFRRDAIAHQRGYEMASKIDMDKITDWQKLFFMPNSEVRKRFFTDKPDYSGL